MGTQRTGACPHQGVASTAQRTEQLESRWGEGSAFSHKVTGEVSHAEKFEQNLKEVREQAQWRPGRENVLGRQPAKAED